MRQLKLLSSISLLLLAACGPATPGETPATEYRLVKAQIVHTGPAAILIEVPGVGAFRDETRLSFKVGGVIENITVREGETVDKGQRLAWLNKQDVNAMVSQASATFEKTQRDLLRGRTLRDQEVISKVQLDNLETSVQAARAQLSQAQFAHQTSEIKAQGKG